jgi:predicted secreted protein
VKQKDIRSRKIAFIPFCAICQGFQAKNIVKDHPAVIKPIIQELLNHEINLVQMPCPEILFEGYERGLDREPKGYRNYDTPEFRELCDNLASKAGELIQILISKGFKVVAIFGIEYSPSCAVNYQFEKGRTLHQKGIFIESLKQELEKRGVSVPFIGINRRSPKKAINKLKEILFYQSSLI